MPDILRATIPASRVHAMRSAHVDQEYRISVATPYTYTEKPYRLYPVIYLLDPNWYFGMVTEIARVMSLQGFQEVIIVGIGYPIDEPLEDNFADILSCRARDCTPVHDEKVAEDVKGWLGRDLKFGGASHFVKFIQEELTPMIEKQYRADPTDRAIAGHSWGGLFVLYSLFHPPRFFQRYLSGSPSLHIGDRIMHRYEALYAKRRKTLPARLYLSAGALEYDTTVSLAAELLEFRAILDERNYKGLKITMKLFDDCNHTEVVAPLFQAGLKAVFS